MSDIMDYLTPKTNQLTADDLIAGPITIRITEMLLKPIGQEQPVIVRYEGGDGKPYLPCKTMARVMVFCWGPVISTYVGHEMTLFRDPNVKWGGMAVGGIRISHMSHIEKTTTIGTQETKGKRGVHVVRPLVPSKPVAEVAPEPAPAPKAPGVADWIEARLKGFLDDATDFAAVAKIKGSKSLAAARAKGTDVEKALIDKMIADTLARIQMAIPEPEPDDMFDDEFDEAAA